MKALVLTRIQLGNGRGNAWLDTGWFTVSYGNDCLREERAGCVSSSRSAGDYPRPRTDRSPLTDPDARSMVTSGRRTGIVGYNVQTTLDAKHHMVVAHEVTNVGHDREQLSSMARRARDAVGKKR